MVRPGSVLAVGAAWCAAAIAWSAWLVPSDGAGGFYLVDHGRVEHYGTRWAAVIPFVGIGALLICLAALVLLVGRLSVRPGAPGPGPPGSVPIGVVAGSALPLLLAGLIPLSVTTGARGAVWPMWLVLAVIALTVVALLISVGRTLRRTRQTTRGN